MSETPGLFTSTGLGDLALQPLHVVIKGEMGLALLLDMVRRAWAEGNTMTILHRGEVAVVFEPEARMSS